MTKPGPSDLRIPSALCMLILLAGGGLTLAPGRAHAAYEDRTMDPSTIGTDADEDKALADWIDPSGPPRTLSLEARAQAESISGSGTIRSHWLLARGTLGTANYGFFTLDAAYQPRSYGSAYDEFNGLASGDAVQRGSFTLFQRALPMAGGWTASNGLGLVQTGNVDLVSQQYRFGVPSRVVLGAATQWNNEGSGLVVQASTGEPVALDPAGQGGYAGLGGRATVAAARIRKGGISYAAQVADYRSPGASSVPSYDPVFGFATFVAPSSVGLMQTLRFDRGLDFVQLNLLNTHEDEQGSSDGTKTGAWADAGLIDGPTEHRGGLQLAARSAALAGHVRGVGHEGRLLPLALEHAASDGRCAVRPPARVRHRCGTRVRLGHLVAGLGQPALPARPLERDRHTGATDARLRRPLGLRASATTRGWSGRRPGACFIELESAADRGDELQFGVDANWSLGERPHEQHPRGDHGARRGARQRRLRHRDQGLQRTDQLQPQRPSDTPRAGESSASTGMSASLQHRLTPRWSVLAAYNDSRAAALVPLPGPSAGPPPIDPAHRAPAPHPLRLDQPALRHAGRLAPRCRWAARRAAAAAASKARCSSISTATASPTPGETRLSNVDLVLDGRYSVRSDAQGRFEFPFVAAGRHMLSVIPDNVPLPWGFAGSSTREVNVTHRETTVMNFGALRN